MTSVTTRAITEDQWPQWRALRLAALATDADAFSSTLAQWSGPGDVEERWRGRLAGIALNLLADLDGEPVGMVSVSLPVDGVAEVLSMWVDPRARGRGVGDALMDAALGWAREQGAHRLGLDVREANHPAIELYARHGFSDAGPAEASSSPQCERRMIRDLT